jgi:transposase
LIHSCYEAGRDGFWLDRYLKSRGIGNLVVDSSSIEVNRRAKQAKTDLIDVQKLLGMLMRYHQGEEKVWSVVTAPSEEDEEARQLHREMIRMKRERTRHSNRIKGLLAGCGVSVEVDRDLPETLAKLKIWDGRLFKDVHGILHGQILREYERLQLLVRQLRALESERSRQIRHGEGRRIEMVRQLLGLRGVGENSAWLYTMECFSWRQFNNRRQLGSLAGLTPPPYRSGNSHRDQGMSKAGSRWIRSIAVELAWCWVRFQPDSELSRWYAQRFAEGSKRIRKIGIVAVARKLLIKLWQYVETGEVPKGAVLSDWRGKINQHCVRPA